MVQFTTFIQTMHEYAVHFKQTVVYNLRAGGCTSDVIGMQGLMSFLPAVL